MFTEKSIVVQAWVRKINQGAVTFNDVPTLSNLRDAVGSVLGITQNETEVE